MYPVDLVKVGPYGRFGGERGSHNHRHDRKSSIPLPAQSIRESSTRLRQSYMWMAHGHCGVGYLA